MQNILVLIFPQIIDGLNTFLKTRSAKARFWVAIIVSILGGIGLNYQLFVSAFEKPDVYDVSWTLTMVGLVVAATQGVYAKYWENHPIRSTVFPTLTTNKQ